MEHVQILADDDEVYARAAYFLDQPEVLKRIKLIRNCWHLGHELIPYDSFENWSNSCKYDFDLTKETAEYYEQIKDKINEFQGKSSPSELEKYEAYKLASDFCQLNPMDFELEVLLIKTGFKKYYREIALKAIVCGEVRPVINESGLSTFQYKELIRDEKISKVINKFYKGKKQKPNIRRDRNWYWEFLSLKDKSSDLYKEFILYKDRRLNDRSRYAFMLNRWNSNSFSSEEGIEDLILDENTLHQAVRRYRMMLKN